MACVAMKHTGRVYTPRQRLTSLSFQARQGVVNGDDEPTIGSGFQVHQDVLSHCPPLLTPAPTLIHFHSPLFPLLLVTLKPGLGKYPWVSNHAQVQGTLATVGGLCGLRFCAYGLRSMVCGPYTSSLGLATRLLELELDVGPSLHP
jgi:hypothetical protein